MVYIKGQCIGGIVTKISSDTIELRNSEFDHIVVRVASIDAAAMV